MNDQRPMIVMNQMSLLTLNMDRPLPLDAALWQSAKAMDLQVQGLESFEEQTNLLFQLSIDMQVKMFNQMCRNVSKFRNRTLRLMDLFMDQDLHGIYRMTIKDLGGMRDQLVYNRNTTMAHRLANLMQEGPLMAAIGGGHFSGYKGLIKLLNSSGYKLTPYHL
jgi:uncharacterized protein YbaP (TraB family)